MVLATVFALLAPTVAAASDIAVKPADLWSPRPLEGTPSVGGTDAPPVTVVPPVGDNAPLWTADAPVWPGAVDVQIPLAPTSAADPAARLAPSAGAEGAAQVGWVPGAPLWVTVASAAAAARSTTNAAPSTPSGVVRVQVQDRAATERAGVEGMLLAVRPVDASARGPVTVGVDYSAIRNAFGGDWASRLSLVALPECALTTPDKHECRVGTPVPSARNDVAASRLVADVDLATPSSKSSTNGAAASTSGGAVVLAATADASSGAGDYKATSLEATGSWQVSGNSGSFSWTYPIKAPAAVTGAAPNVNLAYNSASVDGRTVTKNAQPSWVGDGWDYHPGFIERTYLPCKQDGKDDTGEVCWSDKQQITMSLNGSNTSLVRDDASGVWRTQDGSNAKVELLTGDTANGDNDGEYWKITTTDGTQYIFGKQSSGTSGAVDSRATWTRPVYGNNVGEPCYTADFAQAWCQQAWRWNLAHAIDVRGSLVSYTWAPETNHYARNPSAATPTGTLTPYTRGGQLAKVTYGSKTTDTAGPTAQLVFGTNERCKDGATCPDGSISTATASNWPDVPYDQHCAATGTCENYAPTFWTTRKLAKITAQVKVGTAMSTVDEWVLAHEFVNPGDGTTPNLWLKSITRTGFDGANKSALPSVDFTGTLMNNRVDAAGDNAPPINRRRMIAITTETGLTIAVRYAADAADPEYCVPGALPVADTNTKRCFPVWWNYDAIAEPKENWFHKYVVAEVTESDIGAVSPTRSTRYEYKGGAAWHRDDSELTEDKYRTWNGFRGYAEVVTRSGVATTVTKVTQTSTVYLRGMDGDYKKDGTRRSVMIPGTDTQDSDVLAGFVRETRTHTGDNGTVAAYTVNDPWLGPVTATHTRTPAPPVDPPTPPPAPATLPPLTAQKTATTKTTSKALLANGSWRSSSKTTAFDPTYGVPLTVLDQADGLPDYCTTTTYAHNTTANILSLPVETTAVTGNCATVPGTSTTVSNSRTLYDSQPFGQVGAVGAATGAQTRQSYTGNDTADWVTATTGYDAYGRTTSVTDPLNNTTTTTYAPATGTLPTKVTVTNAKGWNTVTDYAGPRNLAVKTTDANGRVTEQAHDVLGRSTSVWLPGQARSAPASMTFGYELSKTGLSKVTTRKLINPVAPGSYLTSITFLDAFLQVRQTQDQEPRGGVGRLITDTTYDSLGRPVLTSGPYFNAAAPSTTRYVANDNEIPGQTGVFYDGMGRTTDQVFSSKASEQWRTTTIYHGADKTSTRPPTGGTATTTITDARGKAAELRQYKNPVDLGSDDPAEFEKTTYSYDGREQLATVRDQAGNTWTWGYDLLGRQTTANDPDKGVGETHYNAVGQVDWTKDARGQVLWSTYDSLGRKTGLYKDTVTDANLLASWSYDRHAKGQADGSTRYTAGKAGPAYVSEITSFDVGYRPTGTRTVIPTTEGKLAGTYTTATRYNATTGNPNETDLPGVGGLPAETVQYGYDAGGNLKTVGGVNQATGIGTGYLRWVDYDGYGRTQRAGYGPSPKQAAFTTNYDPATGRLLSTILDRQTGPGDTQVTGSVDITNYSYKPSGDVTSISTLRDTGTAGAATDTQCFTYDHLRRIAEAWTDTGSTTTQPGPSVPGIGGCNTTTPTTANIGGPAPYWQSYEFDSTGNRTKLTDHHTTDATGAQDTTTTYTHPAPGTPRPHTVTATSTTAPNGTGGQITTGGTYTYDNTGNTKTRPVPGGSQNLTWDPEGRLASNATATGSITKTETYLYDADGNRILRRGPDNNTLYLGNTELILTLASQKVTGTRYYTGPDGTPTVIRTTDAAGVNKLAYLASDHHGTATTTLDAATLAITRRAQKPYGEDRGTQPPAWPDDKGFLGKPEDSTGLTHIGAREYDPALGRFISVDPIMDLTRLQQMHGYLYAGGNPVTNSDPTGLDYCPSNVCNHDSGQYQEEIRWSSRAWSTEPIIVEVTTTTMGPGPGPGDRPSTTTTTTTSCIGCTKPASKPQTEKKSWWSPKTWLPIVASFVLPDFAACKDPWSVECAIEVGSLTPIGRGTKVVTKGDELLDLGKSSSKGADAAATCRRSSFTPGTLVLLADGTTKPIEDIELGDMVTASDPDTGETGPREVTALITSAGVKNLATITIDTDQGPAVVPGRFTATDNHPLWVESARKWADAGTVRPGDTVRTPSGIQASVIGVSTETVLDQRVHNLTVADFHTYYVLAGATAVLVHNTCGLDLGEGWTPRSISEIRGVADCDYCAVEIQRALGGGDIVQIAGRFPGARPYVYRGVETNWPQHFVVIKDNRVYDAWTGRNGEALEDYVKNFADPNIPGDNPLEILQFTPGSLTPNPAAPGQLSWTPR